MILTSRQLNNIYIYCPMWKIEKYVDLLNKYMKIYSIDNVNRIRMFIAQIGHESGQLRYTEELASGEAYEGRKDLGNTEPGDGKKYKGRGLIQITGKYNYLEISKAFNVSFITCPPLLSEKEYAVKSACWWWKNHGLNEVADMCNLRRATKIINGGYNGLEDRKNLYERAKKYI